MYSLTPGLHPGLPYIAFSGLEWFFGLPASYHISPFQGLNGSLDYPRPQGCTLGYRMSPFQGEGKLRCRRNSWQGGLGSSYKSFAMQTLSSGCGELRYSPNSGTCEKPARA